MTNLAQKLSVADKAILDTFTTIKDINFVIARMNFELLVRDGSAGGVEYANIAQLFFQPDHLVDYYPDGGTAKDLLNLAKGRLAHVLHEAEDGTEVGVRIRKVCYKIIADRGL